MRLLFILLLAILLPGVAMAESYQGIGPLDTLSDVKNRFPQAEFSRIVPGWAQESDVLFEIKGRGMSGVIVVKFDDYRPAWKQDLEKNPEAEHLRQLVEQSDGDAITVNWVRWVPDAPIPIQRLISKFGPPEIHGFSNEDFQPYRAWKKKGVAAFLTDDEKAVVRVDFTFSLEDLRSAYLAKYGFIPSWLKGQVADQQSSPAPKPRHGSKRDAPKRAPAP